MLLVDKQEAFYLSAIKNFKSAFIANLYHLNIH